MPTLDARTIFHVDMDAFFASVEILHNPSLKGKPVIVGGDPSKRGVVSTCSYEARKYGVRSAMSLFEAKKRCPQGIFIEGHYSLYREYSSRVMAILFSYSPMTECVGIDEAYMDVSQESGQYGGAFKMGQQLRQSVLDQTGLTCSVGVGSNKLIAKIASSLGKPNGLYEIPLGKEAEFLNTLSVGKIPGIGTKSELYLNSDGIKIVKDLQDLGMDELIHRYGAFGYYCHFAAWGKDDREVSIEDSPPKSIGAETTFDVDQTDLENLHETLVELFDKAYSRMRRNKMRTRGLSIKLRYNDFRTITRSITFDTHQNEREFLLRQALKFFNAQYDGKIPLRLIGISFEKLTDGYWQPTLWDWEKEQKEKGNN